MVPDPPCSELFVYYCLCFSSTARFINSYYNNIFIESYGLWITIFLIITFVILSLLGVLCSSLYHTRPPNLKVIYFDRLVTGLVLLLRSANLNDRCSWCHYLSCIPTSKWSCKSQQLYCEVSALSLCTLHPYRPGWIKLCGWVERNCMILLPNL